MIQNGSPAGRRKANVMANIFIVKLQLSTIVRSLLCAVAALAVERRSVTRIRGKCSKCSTSRVLVELRANRKLPNSLERTCSYLGPEVMATKRLRTAAASSKKVEFRQD
jgi:hypothetical protein